MSDVNRNNNYVPKDDFMGEWTTLPEKMDDEQFCLRFTYELAARPDQPEQWVQMVSWEIKSIEAQGEYVILDMKFKKDHINLLLNYMKNTFSHTYIQNNVVKEAKHYDLEGLSTKYTLSPFWTARKLTTLALNISKYNSVVTEANKKNKPEETIHIRGKRFEDCT